MICYTYAGVRDRVCGAQENDGGGWESAGGRKPLLPEQASTRTGVTPAGPDGWLWWGAEGASAEDGSADSAQEP